MSPEVSKLDQWVLTKIETEYRDDIQLLIGHNTFRLEEDAALASFSFFFPATGRGYQLAKTFIINGAGYDLFPMSWERIERITELDEDNAPCVGNATVLYARSEEDRQRFLDLQARLRDHLDDPAFMLNKALEKLTVAMELYRTMLFEDVPSKVRKAAGNILNYLAIAVAYSNRTFYQYGHRQYIRKLSEMESIPDDFIRLYRAVIQAETVEETRILCHRIITTTAKFLDAKKKRPEKRWSEPDYHELAGWYEELSYAWREIYYWCDRSEPENAFMRGCFLQGELDIVSEEFALEEFDILGAFTAGDLTGYRQRAEAVQNTVISLIEDSGVTIEKYDTIEQFLEKNS